MAVQSGSCPLPWQGLFGGVTRPSHRHNLWPVDGAAGPKAGLAYGMTFHFCPGGSSVVTPLARLKYNTNQEGCLPPVLLLLACFPLLLPKVNWQLCQTKPLPPPALVYVFFQQRCF